MKAFHEVRSYDSDFMVWHSSYQDISFLAHWHQEIEFIFVRSGSAHLSINEHNFTAHKGDLVVIDTGDFHYSDSSKMKNVLDFIIFDTSILSSLYNHSHFASPLVSASELKRYGMEKDVLALFADVSRELKEKEPYYKEIVTARLRDFWYLLKRKRPQSCQDMTSENKRMSLLYDMQQLLSYMDEHYADNITLTYAAEKMNFSESHFSKVFKKLIGINFVTYLNMVRVEQAAARLKNTSSRVTDVALNCGFNNVRTFNRVFKEITGYTPSQFLKLTDPDSYNLTYYKRKSSDQEFVENDSLTLIKNET
ncbi:helix-turn-helix transcriptional regulator [Murimonas intestini]|uniref:AraC-like DNA-binding protein n=1 Tax=Murimonas intestini TaxID=1337051 RepID=A0AB73T5A9_9FIRM|nr:AraC family transcriptional regulator [Murimonas intestini]MCR1842144.1 AraC family transcriptional regulator [Murimonas intestini]MCR1864880.1 AraC family transcriptional regulator [Murimonas intestini]MCR1884208.1 AraC family transcriptional regulator [Murimonas intestini]